MDEKKLFWLIFIILSLIADFALPLMWGLVATAPHPVLQLVAGVP